METSLSGYLAPNAYGLRGNACVIPCGGLAGEAPLKWSKEQLKYYTNYVLEDRPIDRMFSGFIFNGVNTRDSHFLYPLYVGFGEPSEMQDWQQWIDALFDNQVNLQALHELSGMGKVDVWISMPYPHPFQRQFGKVLGRELDFQLDTDRFAAIIWWIDLFLKRWREETGLHDRLDLRGFLWQRETMEGSDETLVKWVTDLIRSRNYLSLWLPNYGSYGVLKWKELGFDATVVNPNFTGNTSYDYQWIANASAFSRHYHTGLQIIVGEGLIYNKTHHLDYFNLGLPNRHNYMTDSYTVYQFPNQLLETVYKERFVDYIKLYTFVKGLYQRTEYPGIPY